MTPYEVVTRPEVEEDLRSISRDIQKRILTAIRERLLSSPEMYGRPLGGSLKGLRRMRVGDYRVAYQVVGKRVILWAVRHRRNIYPEVAKRRSREV